MPHVTVVALLYALPDPLRCCVMICLPCRVGVNSLSAAGDGVYEALAAHRFAGLRAQHNGTGGLRLHIRFHQVWWRTRAVIKYFEVVDCPNANEIPQ